MDKNLDPGYMRNPHHGPEEAPVLYRTRTRMLYHWGPLCASYDPDCFCCAAWKAWYRRAKKRFPITTLETYK